MTNNTIPNVPRELLERARAAVASTNTSNWSSDLLRDIHAILSAPSPAGVDGLGVVGYVSQDDIKWQGDCTLRIKPYSDYVIPLCRLSDAQAIIDGLRGEVADLRSMLATVSKAGLRVRTERDQQAQRIGELEAALEFACKALAQVTSSDGSGHADIAVSVLRMAGTKDADALHVVEAYKAGAKWRIDAAMSAGNEGE